MAPEELSEAKETDAAEVEAAFHGEEGVVTQKTARQGDRATTQIPATLKAASDLLAPYATCLKLCTTRFRENHSGDKSEQGDGTGDQFEDSTASNWSLLAPAMAAVAAYFATSWPLGSTWGKNTFSPIAYTVQEETETANSTGGAATEQRGAENARQGGDIQNYPQGPSAIINLHGPQEGQPEATPGDKPEVAQQPHQQAPLQNDNNEGRESSHQQELLHYGARSLTV